VHASGPAFHVVRSISGSKGSVQGDRFIMEDPRTIFYLPEDKQAIVYFEWDGPMGMHKLEGYWKTPEGKIAAVSEFSFEAHDKRFGGFWTLTLNETMQTGMWTLEARVDGEVTGTHDFQILSKEKPTGSAAPRELSSAEIYKLAGGATVFIDRMDRHGQRFSRGSGFFLGENVVVTAFQTIDGASALRIIFPNGQQADCNKVLAWNRRQDWAVLEVVAPGAPHLARAEKQSGAVGDRVLLLDTPSEGGRTLGVVDIIGVQDYLPAGRRLSISASPTSGAVGGPLLDTYGRVVGILGGSLLPGCPTLLGTHFADNLNMARATGCSFKVLVVPLDLVAISPPGPLTLAELSAKGEFVPPLTQSKDVTSGVLCKHVSRQTDYVSAVDETNEFRGSDKEMNALISWSVKAKKKSAAVYEIYDLENHRIVQSTPGKLELEPGHWQFFSLKIPIAGLAPGIYRVDLLSDGEPAWRNFFRITE
jgi:Trypsin-like peptidase domain